MLTIFLIFFGVSCVIASFVLAFLDKPTNDSVTNLIITQIIATNAGYLTYQYGLKSSRNKHRIDEFGSPYDEFKPEEAPYIP